MNELRHTLLTPGYHRYMRGAWFVFGMTFSLIWHSWWWLLVVVLMVAARAIFDSWQEESDFDDELEDLNTWLG